MIFRMEFIENVFSDLVNSEFDFNIQNEKKEFIKGSIISSSFSILYSWKSEKLFYSSRRASSICLWSCYEHD